jgi:hypothetical protein
MQKVKIFKQVDGNYQPVVDCAAQFNPEKLALDKKASWKTEKTWQKNIGNTFFTGGDPIKLSVDLFFDTTDSESDDVRDYTEPLMALTLVNLDEAAKVPSPEEIKERLTNSKKESDASKKSLEDMKKAGLDKIDQDNRAIKEENVRRAQEKVRKAEQDLADARSNDDMPSSIIEMLENSLANARQELMNAQTAAAIKGPYELALEKNNRLENKTKELEDQAKGLTAGSKAAPPITKFVWGDFSFVAIVESVKVSYTMFRPDGTPVRAKAKIKLKQIEEETFYPPQNPTSRSTPRKVWVVQEGQRLDWIAYQEYGNTSMWRYLAEINNLDNPMRLRPGQIINLI